MKHFKASLRKWPGEGGTIPLGCCDPSSTHITLRDDMSNAVSIARQRGLVPCVPANSLTNRSNTESLTRLTVTISILFDTVDDELLTIAVGVVVTQSGARSC